jgi:hypothetical protein
MAYAVAGLVTASGSVAEGAIHYSGPIDVRFPGHPDRRATFPLDQPGDALVFEHLGIVFAEPDFAGFKAVGLRSASMRGHGTESYAILSKLNRGSFVSQGTFSRGYRNNSNFGTLAFNCYGEFDQRGIGYIGFAFNSGTGKQYGWARVFSGGCRSKNAFELLDYACADPGEPIRAGQKSSTEMVPEESNDIIPQEGSLGALALGAMGLLGWRKRRSQSPR